MVHSYNGILFSNRKVGVNTNMNDSQGNHAEWKVGVNTNMNDSQGNHAEWGKVNLKCYDYINFNIFNVFEVTR